MGDDNTTSDKSKGIGYKLQAGQIRPNPAQRPVSEGQAMWAGESSNPPPINYDALLKKELEKNSDDIDIDKVREYLTAGADPFLKNGRGQTPEAVARSKHRWDVIHLISISHTLRW